MIRLWLSSLRKVVKTVLRKRTGSSDLKRWRSEKNLYSTWDTRTAMLASFIAPGSSVLEFGAGRKVLPNYLPEGCNYTPSDLVDRGQGTIICDLNATQLPAFPFHDAVVFSGVLEYVNDLQRLISHLAGSCHVIAASYAVTDFAEQNTIFSRRQFGWVNDFSSRHLVDLFAEHGFLCKQMVVWDTQHLFHFIYNNPTAGEPLAHV